MNQHLRETGNYLRNRSEENFVYENDGVVGHDECMWYVAVYAGGIT